MSKRNILSAIIFICSVLLAVVFYAVVANRYNKIWFVFEPIFFLCVITFALGIGLLVAAVLIERDKQN